MRSKDDVTQRLLHNLVLGHISNKVIKDGLIACSYINSEKRGEFLSSMIGTMDEEEGQAVGSGSDIKHISADMVMRMSDEDRAQLYDKIIKSVKIK